LATYLPLRALSRDRELAADRTAALWLGRPALLAATLVKVAGQRDQIPRSDLRASGLAPLGLVAGPRELPGWLASHPPLDRRLAQLDQLTRLLR
jgi:heat shock protein HtpX